VLRRGYSRLHTVATLGSEGYRSQKCKPFYVIARQSVSMVEVFAVASGKGGTGKTTSTLALGMALAEDYDVTVVDADTGMANLLFHAGLADVDTTLHDVLAADVPAEAAVYERFGMSVVPCGTSLAGFRDADPGRLRDVVADLAADTDVILLDSAAALGSRAAVLPIVLADRVVIVLQPTIPSLSDGLKVQEYAATYDTGIAGLLFNRVRDDEAIDEIADKAARYFEGPTLATVPESDAARAARRAGEPLLAHAPEAPAAAAFREAAAAIDVAAGEHGPVADRFRSAVIPDQP
jgi:septum site-determining protein MinD